MRYEVVGRYPHQVLHRLKLKQSTLATFDWSWNENFPMFTKHTDFSIQIRYLTVIAACMQYVSKSLHIH